ncbi:hypothetical protein BCR37DRAFT_386569 [Protomyces lactucae-debilis]|uniref:Uncharacterized protein n=1 Tax=Protomyces lactucae-debilis TaxID=2754530 RepID=A0A1Y2FLE9_PROLT|nr:uncharacterized protein BCR37DRAFT_386569 [Protomyces lactucae-debilis]ORY84407.1 hypothetical protein BCR37DRAFT_386569 [Protomyces lactucae-debilis]
MPDADPGDTSETSTEYQFGLKHVGTVYQDIYLHLGSQIMAYSLVRTDVKPGRRNDEDSRRTVAFCSICRTDVAKSLWRDMYKNNHWWGHHARKRGNEGLFGRWTSKYPKDSWPFDEETFKMLETVPDETMDAKTWSRHAKKATRAIEFTADPVKSQEKPKRDEIEISSSVGHCEPQLKTPLDDQLLKVWMRTTEELRSMEPLEAWPALHSTGGITELLGAASKVLNPERLFIKGLRVPWTFGTPLLHQQGEPSPEETFISLLASVVSPPMVGLICFAP